MFSKNNGIFVWLLTIILIVLFAISAAGCGFGSKSVVAEKNNQRDVPVTREDKEAPHENDRINILLLGLDDGDPENPGGPRRSDTMMVASINPGDNTVNIMSIPRDSRVNIPGYQGYDKITHAFYYGGADLAARTVETNFNIPIDHTIIMDWKAFIKVVDILGGVDIAVEHDMNYEDPYENLSIHLTKGYQHLNGQQSGQYVRFRHDELGDIGRVQRQSAFLKAFTNRLLRTGTILKLPSLVTTINQYVKTDMNTYALVKIASSLKDLHADSMQADMIPGEFATIDDISYWIPNMEKTQQIVNSKFIKK